MKNFYEVNYDAIRIIRIFQAPTVDQQSRPFGLFHPKVCASRLNLILIF